MNANEEIKTIFDKNKVADLNRFLDKRSCLNTSNQLFNYLFNFLQASSIVLTSIGQTYSNPYCIWGGISIASLAGVIHHIEQTNQKISKTLMMNIKAIKADKYIDEAVLDLDNDASPAKEKSILNESGATTPSALRSISTTI
jgi:hypothetical protein